MWGSTECIIFQLLFLISFQRQGFVADRKAWKPQASPHQPPGPLGTDTNAQGQPSTEMLSPLQVPHLSS